MLGRLLVASPSLNGNPFQKTVILILQDNDKGTFGVCLNRPANDEVRQAWEEETGHYPYERCVVNGGPVGGPVFAIHQDEEIAEVAMPGGIYVSANEESIQVLTEQADDRYRIVFGVASWQVGQLRSEIEQGVWYSIPSDSVDVFGDTSWLWEKSLRQYGQEVTCEVLGISSLPADVSLN